MVSRQYLRLVEGPPSGGFLLFDGLVWAGRHWGPRSGPACAGPALFAPPRLAPGSPVGGAGRPPGRPVGPLRWSSGAGARPPRRLGGPPVLGLGAGGGAPPRGPGLALSLAWCRPVLPTRRRGGALGPAAVWPLLLAPAPFPRGGRRAAAASRQPPRRQHISHGVQRRHGTALMVQRTADPLNVAVLLQ